MKVKGHREDDTRVSAFILKYCKNPKQEVQVAGKGEAYLVLLDQELDRLQVVSVVGGSGESHPLLHPQLHAHTHTHTSPVIPTSVRPQQLRRLPL